MVDGREDNPKAGERTPGRPEDSTEALGRARARTPARVLVGRAGAAYRAATWLELRRDHAAARDAVRAELDPGRDLGAEFVAAWGLFEVATRAADRRDYLLRPDRGRSLSDAAIATLSQSCPIGADVQVAIGDGLSAAAVAAQVPTLLPSLIQECRGRGWTVGRPFLIRHCRVGVLNEIGRVLGPAVAVLLIGERPGLTTASSLSAYLAHRPGPGDDDSRRNLISNIHERGVPPADAARRIADLIAQMLRLRLSGVALKEGGPEIAHLPS